MKRILKQTEIYYRKKPGINKVVLSKINNQEIIHGNYAINKQVAPFLRVQTKDIDVYSPQAKGDAKRTEKALDKYMGFNAFLVKPAKHNGTVKIKSRITGATIADYTQPKEKIPYKKIQGFKYATLAFLKKRAKAITEDPEFEFRHDKDRDTYNRISIAEGRQGRKRWY